ncbi:hypothetical protein EFA69_19295 [Rufibacter immobilis]|uniref:Uncharacterized protein n=1 Tax=Rufibacter immobilis TaxID=1348778 RepID=A0A3M9MRP3_9BACT|nr:hypothetical protein EFA69_19295 [Rufibacter immobilis]
MVITQRAIAQNPGTTRQGKTQEITVVAVGDSTTKSITLEEEIKKSVVPGKSYLLKVTQVNSAHTSLKVTAKSKEIYTPLPEVLKTVLPGISGSISGVKFVDTTNVSDEQVFFDINNQKLEKLNLIKKEAEKLHTLTLFSPAPDKAKSAYTEIAKKYNLFNEDSLAVAVTADIHFLLALKEMADKFYGEEPSLEAQTVSIYSQITAIGNELKKNDYQMFFDYIRRSRTAKDFVTSKNFTASKDLVELDIVLVDTFTKDTLAKETRTLYTKSKGVFDKRSYGLSFSTGFVYSEMLSDQPYFLRARPDENMAVLPDKQVIGDISIGGLAHLYYKVSPFTRIGPSVGLSVSPFDGKSRYLMGGSLLLGREKMLGVAVGRAWAKVKELSAAVRTDSQGRYLPKGTTTIPTVDRIDNKWFVALTYNLFSTRK